MNENNIIKINGCAISTEVLMTDQILLQTADQKKQLRTAIEELHLSAFPKLPEYTRQIYIDDYFTTGSGSFRRQAIFFKNESGRLIAANICNCGKFEYEVKIISGIYLISSAVLPEYQSYGIGQYIGVKLLELQPDVLFTTSTQSSALHSRVKLVEKGLVSGYDVYPKLMKKDGEEILVTVPYKDLDFAINSFRQTYAGLVDGDWEKVHEAVRNLTVLMVRKNLQEEIQDFNPWEKNGREDRLAKALGVNPKDAVLVMFKKNKAAIPNQMK
ncbi:MAG: hypothetical protein AB7S75_15475 [Desulfococcaceae bacterium]